MSRFYSCSFLSLTIHASFFGWLYSIPLQHKLDERFQVAGVRKAMTVDVNIYIPPSPQSIEMEGDDKPIEEPPKESIKPRETQALTERKQEPTPEPVPKSSPLEAPQPEITPRPRSAQLQRVQPPELIEPEVTEKAMAMRPREIPKVEVPIESVAVQPIEESTPEEPIQESVQPRETQDLKPTKETSQSSQLVTDVPRPEIAPQLKPVALQRVENTSSATEPEIMQEPTPARPRVPASTGAPAVSIVLSAPKSLGLDDLSADLTENKPPAYPEAAYRNGLQGTVVLRLTIDLQGKMSKVEVVTSSGHTILDQAAIDAVKAWRGKPALRGGEAVESEEVLPIRFKL